MKKNKRTQKQGNKVIYKNKNYIFTGKKYLAKKKNQYAHKQLEDIQALFDKEKNKIFTHKASPNGLTKCDRIKTKRQASRKESGPLRTGKQPWEEKKTGIKN